MSGLSATRVNVYEVAQARGELDSQVSEAASSLLSCAPSMRLSNLRLLLTGLGTALACLAQFYPPGKYPANFWGLVVACPAFVVVNALVTYWLPLQEQDIACEIASRRFRSCFDTKALSYAVSVDDWASRSTRPLGELFTASGHVRLKVVRDMVSEVLAGAKNK